MRLEVPGGETRMLNVILATVGVLAVVVGASSRLLRQLPITPPLLGLAAGVVVGPALLGTVEIIRPDQPQVMGTATRLLLAVALLAVALRYPVEKVRRLGRPVTVLLLVILPAMAATVAGLGVALLGLPVAVAAALGAALAPTDPVLASGVVTGPPAERDIPESLRQILSMESGANDGLALPLTVGTVALVGGTSVAAEFGRGLLEAGWGAVLGGAIGLGAGKLLRTADERNDIGPTAVTLFALGLAVAVLGLVSLAGGNDILAVFVAGLAFNHQMTGSERIPEAEIDEGLNQFLVLPVFLLFGAVLPWKGWWELGWAGLLFAVAVLLLRRLPWVLLVHRSIGMRWGAAVWLGWFGPIGVAAIFYLSFLHAAGVTDPAIWHAGSLVIAASTVVHGVTAGPGRRRYAQASREARSA